MSETYEATMRLALDLLCEGKSDGIAVENVARWVRAALAAATAREEASKNMEQHATAVLDDWDGHARRLVVWCYNNPRRLNLTGSPTNWPNESEAEYVARALAAAKGGQDG